MSRRQVLWLSFFSFAWNAIAVLAGSRYAELHVFLAVACIAVIVVIVTKEN